MLAYSSRLKKFAPEKARGVGAKGGGMFWTLRRRQHPRFEIPLEGVVRKGEKTVPFRLRNISAGGALIEIDSADLFELNAHLRIGHSATMEIPDIGTFKARPTRMHWKFAGFSFENGNAEIGAFIKHWTEAQVQPARPN
ncbi:MAG: PilZ domain-containing protein [Alphaproteobacteria bacterium]|nr:PilZ domain-containing protein [Alphaproteobacteria bacterium]